MVIWQALGLLATIKLCGLIYFKSRLFLNWTNFSTTFCIRTIKKKTSYNSPAKRKKLKNKKICHGRDSNSHPKKDHTPRHYAESPYVTYRTKISASSALSGITPISLVIKEGGNSRILVPLNNCPAPLGYRARLLIWRTK